MLIQQQGRSNMSIITVKCYWITLVVKCWSSIEKYWLSLDFKHIQRMEFSSVCIITIKKSGLNVINFNLIFFRTWRFKSWNILWCLGWTKFFCSCTFTYQVLAKFKFSVPCPSFFAITDWSDIVFHWLHAEGHFHV